MISESTYEVAVLTGDLPRAETEAGVYCTLVGSWGDTGRCVLDESTQNEKPFRQGQVTVSHATNQEIYLTGADTGFFKWGGGGGSVRITVKY